MARRVRPWRPSPTQERILEGFASVYELLITGEVGSGKTEAGVMAPVVHPEYRESEHFKALILRHDGADLDKEIVPRTERANMYRAYAPGASYNGQKRVWRLPAGGRVVLTHAKDLHSHHGPEYQYVYFDELTHFTELQYTWFPSRLRSAVGLPIRIRAGTNPTGPGRAWVKRRWGPWLDRNYLSPRPDAHPDSVRGAASLAALGLPPRPGQPPCESGQVLWYSYDDEFKELWVPEGTPGALSRSCLLTRTADNTVLSSADPSYGNRVKASGAVLYHQLARNDWDVEDAEEGVFKREWFASASNPLLVAHPAGLIGVVRRWDFSYTKKGKSDYSVGVLFGWTKDGHYHVLHVLRMRGNPDEVKREVLRCAQSDGREVKVIVPIDYAAGLYVQDDLVRLLAGYQVEGVREKGAKEVRIATLQPQAQAGRIHLVAGQWNNAFLDECASYPKGHDDQLDALAGAFLWAVESGKGPTAEEVRIGLQAAEEISRALSGHTEGPALDFGVRRRHNPAAGYWDPDRI